MMVNGQNVLEAANFVKCCQMTVTKYWTMWLTTGKLSKEKDKPGPKPALGVGALLYLFYLVSGNRVYTIAQYRERLREDLGHVVSDWVVMRALQKLGLHRKKPSVKKVEALAPHSQLLRQRYFDVVFAFRLLIGPSSIHRYIHIDETYVNFDNTRARKARAPNGTAATVVDFDSRGPKYGQMAALCTAGFFAQFVYPCVERSTTRDLFEWWLCFILMPVLAQAGGGVRMSAHPRGACCGAHMRIAAHPQASSLCWTGQHITTWRASRTSFHSSGAECWCLPHTNPRTMESSTSTIYNTTSFGATWTSRALRR